MAFERIVSADPNEGPQPGEWRSSEDPQGVFRRSTSAGATQSVANGIPLPEQAAGNKGRPGLFGLVADKLDALKAQKVKDAEEEKLRKELADYYNTLYGGYGSK